MSVQANTYVMYGVLLPYGKFKDQFERLEPYMDSAFKGIHHRDGVCVLYDGMNGKYVAIGRVLAKTGNHEGFGEPIELLKHEPDDADEIHDAICAVAGFQTGSPDVLVITHYR